MGTGAPLSDLDEFEELVDATHGPLLGFASRRLADRHDVEDVLAETFAVAWRRRSELPDPPLPWLYGVCAKVISTHRRATRRRLRLWARVASERVDTARDPADLHASRSRIAAAFARLSQRDREVLRLTAWDGLSIQQAATVANCSVGAFRVRHHRARRRLAKHLAACGHEELNRCPIPGVEHR